ncbi:MAG: acyltransferase family protein [Terracidiphilus sp.]
MKRPSTDASVHLDAIRGLAAVWVLLGHSRGFFIKSGLTQLVAAQSSAPAQSGLPGVPALSVPESIFSLHWQFRPLLLDRAIASRMAVIVFFVLSGYLVGGSVLRTMRKGVFSWKTYLFQRLTRLWVVLIPALLIGAAFDFCGLKFLPGALNIYHAGPLVAPNIGRDLTLTAFFGNLFFLQGIVTRFFGTNGPLWSLSFEFWYYLSFPLLAAVLTGFKSIHYRIAGTLLLLPLMLFCGWKIGIYFLIWLLGAAIAALPLCLPSAWKKSFTYAAVLLLFFTAFLELRFPIIGFLSDIILGIVFALFLWTVLHAQDVTVPKLYRVSAQTLSGMSYTLYLAHAPMLIFISALLVPVWGFWPFSLTSLLKLTLIDLTVFAASYLIYYCFERNTPRIRNWLLAQW